MKVALHIRGKVILYMAILLPKPKRRRADPQKGVGALNILAIESSCDETAVAIVRDGREILTDCIASQVDLHRIYGGVVPEIASRKHIEAIYGLADQALIKTGLGRNDVPFCIFSRAGRRYNHGLDLHIFCSGGS